MLCWIFKISMCLIQNFSQCQTFVGVIKHSVVQMWHVQHVVEPVNLNWCHPAFILLPHWHVALSKDMKGPSYFLLPKLKFIFYCLKVVIYWWLFHCRVEVFQGDVSVTLHVELSKDMKGTSYFLLSKLKFIFYWWLSLCRVEVFMDTPRIQKILPTNSTCTILIVSIKQFGIILLSGSNPTIRKCSSPQVWHFIFYWSRYTLLLNFSGLPSINMLLFKKCSFYCYLIFLK